MSLIYCDGFDHYTDLGLKWSAIRGEWGALPSIATGAGRFSSDALYLNNKALYVQKDFGPRDTYIVGAAIWISGAVFPEANGLFSFWNGSVMECSLWVDYTNVVWFSYVNGNGPPDSYYTTGVIQCDTWNYFEIKVTAHPAGGTVVVRLNGVEILNRTGIRTAAVAYLSGIAFAGNYPGSAFFRNSIEQYYDDVYICDTAGSYNTDFLGDVRVEEILPNADGFYQDWTRDVPGSDHFGRVNENPPDGDATFVYDNVLNTKDTYTFPSITPASGSTIYACAVNFHTKKLESGFRGLSAIARLGGVDGNGTESRITTDYNIHQSIMERDPNGDAWTVNNVNASEFGPEITT